MRCGGVEEGERPVTPSGGLRGRTQGSRMREWRPCSQAARGRSGPLPVTHPPATPQELWRRSSTGEPADPRGGDLPFVNARGEALVDVRFYEGLRLYGEPEPYERVAAELRDIAGVVAHGLLAGRAAALVVVGERDAQELAL
jgi:hypothetical protein